MTDVWGPPQDILGECNARLYLADDYGDNQCTIRCNLPERHDGDHQEKFTRSNGGQVTIFWTHDEKDEESFEEEDDFGWPLDDKELDEFLTELEASKKIDSREEWIEETEDG